IASDYLSANDADNDSLTYSIVEQSTKGSVTLVDANSGQFQYTPNPGAVGIDIFYFGVV
ncbi:hypothetical protein MHK_006810, partial [Candidatus Magnetomorum sp. HK-1]